MENTSTYHGHQSAHQVMLFVDSLVGTYLLLFALCEIAIVFCIVVEKLRKHREFGAKKCSNVGWNKLQSAVGCWVENGDESVTILSTTRTGFPSLLLDHFCC